VKFLARLETHCPSRSNRNLGPGPRIPPNPSLAWPYVEHAKTSQLNSLSVRKRVLEAFKDRVNGMLGLVARQAGTFNHSMNNVLLDQFSTSTEPLFLCIDATPSLRKTEVLCLQWYAFRQQQAFAYPLTLLIGNAATSLSTRSYSRKMQVLGHFYYSFSRFLRRGSSMSIQSDRWIREQALKGMIEPFSEKQVREGVISYGLSSYGYDLRVSNEFKIFTNVNSAVIDPKNFDERSFVSVEADSVIVPPNSFALARSIEYFRIPRNVLTICVGKSTYARCGIIVNVTPFEPEWEGYVTLEISNTTPLPARVYANEGLCQILFFKGDEPCEISYADRKGKYQKQQGIVLPKL
jgi:dCTP deaminase